MTSLPCRILIDTNIWLDEYIGIRPNGEISRQLFDICFAKEIAFFTHCQALKTSTILLSPILRTRHDVKKSLLRRKRLLLLKSSVGNASKT